MAADRPASRKASSKARTFAMVQRGELYRSGERDDVQAQVPLVIFHGCPLAAWQGRMFLTARRKRS